MDNLTDKEKLARIKEIFEGNLFSIFTAFTVDLDRNVKDWSTGEKLNTLEKYVEMKELLGITRGVYDKEDAIKYDTFRREKPKQYEAIMRKLDERLKLLYDTQGAPFHRGELLSTYMVMYALYPINIAPSVLNNLSMEELQEKLRRIDEYKFSSG